MRAESVVRPMLADAGAARLVLEESGPVVYHCFENGRLYHMEGGDGEEEEEDDDEAEAEEEEEAEDEDAEDEEARDAASLRLGAVRVDAAFAPAVEALLSEDAVGAGVRVGDLLEAGGDDAGGDAEGLVATVRDLVAAGVVALVER